MSEWTNLRFKDIFKNYSTGITPPSKDESFFKNEDEGYTWITIADMTQKYLSHSNLNLSQHALDVYAPLLTPKGSLLFSFKLSVGKLAFANEDLYTNEAIVSISPSSKYCLEYMYYMLPAILYYNATENIYGAKMLNQQIIANMLLTIPPLPEQKKIADYLDEKTAAIDKQVSLLEQKKEKYTLLRKSIIKKAVTEGLEGETRDWNFGRLKEQIKTLESGKRPSNDKEEVLSIGGEHIQNGHFYLEHEMYVSEQTYSNSFGKIALGDILVVKDGATIGKCMYVDTMPHEKMLINEHVYRIVASKYYYYYIVSPMGQYWFRSRNMSSAQESIKQNTILNLPVPVPPLSEQRAIADYLDEKCAKIDAIVANINQQIEKYKLLRRALINEVVTGQKII